MKRKRKSEAKGKEVDLLNKARRLMKDLNDLTSTIVFYSLTHKEQYSVVKPFSEKKRRKI